MYPSDTLILRMLPDVLLMKDVIQNCTTQLNYELYLVDYLNASSEFSKYGSFEWQLDQSHGEADAVSKGYEIDFKRFGSNSSFVALSELTPTKCQTSNGLIVSGVSKRQEGMDISRIHVLFRGLTQKQLSDIDNGSNELFGKEVSNDARGVLRVLKTQKNLLLYYTYYCVPKDEKKSLLNEDIEYICSVFTKCFSSCMVFRDEYLNVSSHKLFDTYFAFIAGGFMNLCSCKYGTIELCDQIPLGKSRFFMDAYKLATPIERYFLKVKP